MSKSLFIKKVNDQDLALDYNVLRKTFESAGINHIDQSPWSADFPYQPDATFRIVHSEEFVGLYYNVKEEFLKAQAIRANESVWEDSCVEFFISLDNKETYFNFEFNVLGTGLIGYGPAVKSERNRLSAELIDSIDLLTQVTKKNGLKTWEMYLLIPKNLIGLKNYQKNVIHANFYKCGDALPNPHFIAWNYIDNPTPNFHLPQFFGELILE